MELLKEAVKKIGIVQKLPEELISLEPPKVNPTKGVILSGRGQYGFTAILPITIIQQSL